MKNLRDYINESKLDMGWCFDTISFFLDGNGDLENKLILDLFKTKSIFTTIEHSGTEHEIWDSLVYNLKNEVETNYSELRNIVKKYDSQISKQLMREFKETYKELLEQ